MFFIIYGKSGCSFCDAAKKLLEERSHEFDYLTLGVDYTKEELKELVPDLKTVPQIWVIENDNAITRIGGYDDLISYLDDPLTSVKRDFASFYENDTTFKMCTRDGYEDIVKIKQVIDENTILVSGVLGQGTFTYEDIESYETAID